MYVRSRSRSRGVDVLYNRQMQPQPKKIQKQNKSRNPMPMHGYALYICRLCAIVDAVYCVLLYVSEHVTIRRADTLVPA